MNATRTAIIVTALFVIIMGVLSGPIYSLVEKTLV